MAKPIQEIWELPDLAIPVPKGRLEGILGDECLQDLEQRLGNGFVALSNSKSPSLHQAVLVMEFVRAIHGRKVTYKSIDEFREMCQKKVPLPASRSVVAFLYQTTYTATSAQIHAYFDSVEYLGAQFRPYPHRTEIIWDARKVPDIEVLDEIARSAQNRRFSYRPITCFGNSPCELSEEVITIQKRSTSCASRHVKQVKKSHLLRCSSDKSRLRSEGSEVYFHQKYEPLLMTFGEFRVFVVCFERACALRGREPSIEHIVRTRWSEDKSCVATNVTPTDALWQEIPASPKELHKYVLYVVSCLRQRTDWAKHYESLEVGVRLDVGVSETGLFFVNEITRWYSADFFSSTTLEAPHTQLCDKYATALHSYFP
ncbi:hypothetical protein H2198_006767 [Neophaeococcomyces mojaviensis]|uniref:Uncharacterized protein n=1 Tax=Neophaeococcomyces mojaviensis TaxID=3383035 RepID=A0ACC3A204_9EURO|nr:hypothetical protein H2198_006767 [Knufia sp. JES_112]